MKERKVSRKEMVEQLELSPYGFDLMLIRGTMDIRTLEKISDILTVPMTYWFVENMDILESNKFDQISILLDQLKNKDKQIDFLQRMIDDLKADTEKRLSK